jgi:hypothetical protein
MDKLGTPAGRAFGKIIFFQEQHLEPSLGSVNCNTQPGCSTANNNHVPGYGSFQLLYGILSFQLLN